MRTIVLRRPISKNMGEQESSIKPMGARDEGTDKGETDEVEFALELTDSSREEMAQERSLLATQR